MSSKQPNSYSNHRNDIRNHRGRASCQGSSWWNPIEGVLYNFIEPEETKEEVEEKRHKGAMQHWKEQLELKEKQEMERQRNNKMH